MCSIKNNISRKHFSIIILIGSILLITACSSNDDNKIKEQAQASFQEIIQFNGIPYQNDQYKIISNDGTYANVDIKAQLRLSESSDWTEHETNISCRKIGKDWQCDPIYQFEFSQAEVDKQLAAQEKANVEATQFWQNIQDTIKAEVIGTPYINPATNLVVLDVKVTNDDNQSHNLCVFSDALITLPENILSQFVMVRNPIEWWGGYFNDESNCSLLIDGNSTKTISIDIGRGGSGVDAQNPGAENFSSLSDVTFIQLCTTIYEVDGSKVSIEWKQDPSQSCDD